MTSVVWGLVEAQNFRRRLAWMLAATILIVPGWAHAAIGDPQQKSTNYSINESTIGATGDYGEASANFKQLGGIDGGSTLGDLTVGNSKSSTYQTNSGTNTTAAPVLSFSLNTPSINLGILSASATNTGTATFNIKNYTSSGYAVTIAGSTPTYNGRALSAMTTGGSQSIGTEQFGINLVANTAPAIGANPVQVPSSSFSYGVAATNYNTVNTYRYNSGEVIASSQSSSGETDFTISYIVNIDPRTPAGTYVTNQSLIATATF